MTLRTRIRTVLACAPGALLVGIAALLILQTNVCEENELCLGDLFLWPVGLVTALGGGLSILATLRDPRNVWIGTILLGFTTLLLVLWLSA